MELKTSFKSICMGMLKDSAKGIPRALVYLLIFLLGNVIQQGFVIKMLGGVTQKEYRKYQWHIGKIENGKIYRSNDLVEEKEILRKKIRLSTDGVLLIAASANGKYKEEFNPEKNGFVEVFIYVDDIECAHGSSFVGDSRYRNDAKSMSTEATVFQLIDGDEHEIKVIAVYYGSLERDETRFSYLTVYEANKLN